MHRTDRRDQASHASCIVRASGSVIKQAARADGAATLQSGLRRAGG
ncbi:hypothetical protein J2794_001593 [Paraburkholderia terricola]|nr:hypothetical protein [Paraburkholderia terricola]MDR6445502.1 hypothetical protein [Paraburkholderia terricola]